MPHYALLQPSGKYASFDTVDDVFTSRDLTREEAAVFWRGHVAEHNVEQKLRAADNDDPCGMGAGDPCKHPDRLGRWRCSLCSMFFYRGAERVLSFLDGVQGMPYPEQKRWYVETLRRMADNA